MSKVTLTDKIKTVNSGLFVIIGVIILIRSLHLSAGLLVWLPLLVGISFIAFGIYRLRFVLNHFRSGQ